MNKICVECKKTFTKPPKETYAYFAKRKYCSHTCYHKGSIVGFWKKCLICKKKFYRMPSQEFWRGKAKYCSKKCSGFSKRTGERTHYGIIHHWLKDVFGRADKCEHQ